MVFNEIHYETDSVNLKKSISLGSPSQSISSLLAIVSQFLCLVIIIDFFKDMGVHALQCNSRTASDMDGTLHTDLAGFKNIRDIKKSHIISF